RLAEDGGAATSRGPVLLAALPLGLHARGALDAGDLVVGARGIATRTVRSAGATAAATTTARGAAVIGLVGVGLGIGLGHVGGLRGLARRGLGFVVGVGVRLPRSLPAAAAPTAPASTATAAARAV